MRIFDVLISSIVLILLMPFLIVIAILIKLESEGTVFFRQSRVGKNNVDFKIYKFRTMFVGSEAKGLLTIGDQDVRVTKSGVFLRKYKVDELPQLINVLLGEMSLVGPRPEVRKYVNLYTKDQLQVLNILPGITDMASIVYRNESEILSKQSNPEEYYIHTILPDKIKINLNYSNNKNIFYYFKTIFRTITVIVFE